MDYDVDDAGPRAKETKGKWGWVTLDLPLSSTRDAF